MTVTVKTSGLKELEQLLLKMPSELRERPISAALRAGANIVAAEMKARVPVRTGKLRRSIVVRKGTKQKNTQHDVIIGFLRPTGLRAHLTEFGTRYAAARPFIRPAFDAKVREAIVAISEKLRAEVLRAALKLAGPYAKSGLRRR